jgi:hypothetical protein
MPENQGPPLVMGNITLARALNSKQTFWQREWIRAERALSINPKRISGIGKNSDLVKLF